MQELKTVYRRAVSSDFIIMAQQLNFEDSFFYIKQMMNTLKTVLNLELPVEIFQEKILEDILFIDESIRGIQIDLIEKEHLIKREQLLKTLIRMKKSFVELLEDISEFGPRSSFFPSLFIDKYKSIIDLHRDDIILIKEILLGLSTADPPNELVSQEEISLLLTPDNAEQAG